MSEPPASDILRALTQFVSEAHVLSPNGVYMRTGDGVPIAVLVAIAQEAIPRYQLRLYWEQHPNAMCADCGRQCRGNH